MEETLLQSPPAYLLLFGSLEDSALSLPQDNEIMESPHEHPECPSRIQQNSLRAKITKGKYSITVIILIAICLAFIVYVFASTSGYQTELQYNR